MLTPFRRNQERSTAVILERSHVTAVELAHTSKGYVLMAAGSLESQTNFDNQAVLSDRGAKARERAFATELSGFLKKSGARPDRISFGLATSMLMLETVPMDDALEKSERSAQALWELKQFQSECSEHTHALITQKLAPDPVTGIAPSVVVGVRRSFITFLEHTASSLSARFHILDVQQFCAENAFIANYPQAREQRTLVIGMDDHALTASTLYKGASLDVQVRSFSGDDTRMIYDCARSSGAEQIFLHGSGASYQLCESMMRTLDLPVELIDPFRVVLLPSSLKGLADIKARRHEFTAAVGLAMRTE